MADGPSRVASPKRGRLLILFLTLLLIAGAVLFLTFGLIRFKERFRMTSDRDFLKETIASADADYFSGLAEPYWKNRLTAYEKEEQVAAYMRETLAPDRLTFARADDYTDEAPSFLLYADGREIFTVKLLRKPDRWQIVEIALSDRCELGQEPIIEAPRGAAVILNGVPLRRADAVTVPYSALTEFEASLADTYTCDRYTPGTLFLPPETEASLDGYPLTLFSVEDRYLRYGYPPSYTFSRTLTVPYGSSVTVNGIPLSTAYLIRSGVRYPFLTRFDEKKDSITSTVYRISGLFREPEIVVLMNGTVLQPDGDSGNYRLPDARTRSIAVTAPSYATVKLNGVSLGASEVVEYGIVPPIFDSVTGYDESMPTLVRYQASGLLTDPVLTATDAEGRALKVNPYDSAAGEIVFSFSETDPIPDKELRTVKTFAKLYILYEYGGPDNLTKHYNDVTSMTPGKSAAFQTLRSAYSRLAKAVAHKSIKVGTLSVVSYSPHSETVYSVIVKVPFSASLNGVSESREMTLEILYAYVGEIRRIINYRVLKDVPA